MAAFPTLSTGAVAQYPLSVGTRFSTQSVRFLDGSRQSYRAYGAALRRWTVNLDLLTDRELAALAAFAAQQGSAPFAFTDPVTGNAAPKCVLAGDSFSAFVKGEAKGQTGVVIEEVV